MSYNKRKIPEIKELKNIYESYKSDKEFIKDVIGKADTIVGSVESLEFLNKIKYKIKHTK